MLGTRPDSPAQPAEATASETELRATVRVLGAVVEELAERVELLETRESVRVAAGRA